MLKKANIQWTAKTLCNQIAKEQVLFDCVVQRGLVWKPDAKSLLIHSMVEGFPIPALYFAKQEGGKYDALDGKQRSNAISTFLAGEFALTDNTPPIVDENGEECEVAGLFFADLPEWAQDAIKDYSLTIYYFEDITDDEVRELFYRINNGKPLTAVELTRVKAKSLESFQRIALHPAIAENVTEKAKNGHTDENIAMQAWAVCYSEIPDLSTKAFRPTIEAAEVTTEHEAMLLSCLDWVNSVYNTLDAENKEGKRILRKVKTRTHFVSCIYLAKLCQENGINQKQYCALVYEFFNTTKTTTSTDYNSAIGAGSARLENVQRRLNALQNLASRKAA